MDTIEWLLQGDPSIRWQVLRDLVDAPAADVMRERERVAREGWPADLLAAQGADGLWRHPDEPLWVPNFYTMLALADLGADPADPVIAAAVDRFVEAYRWDEEFGAKPFFAGEVEPCINGRVLATGAYFDRIDDDLVSSLLDQQLDDGGWNCESPPSRRSSFDSTICVLDGLSAYLDARGPDPVVDAAVHRGEEYLLTRHLFRRRSSGEVVAPEVLQFVYPSQWHYDVLRALDYFRTRGAPRDPRMAEAVQIVRSRADATGRWALDRHPQFAVLDTGEQVGEPSRPLTLRALRVLRWWDAG